MSLNNVHSLVRRRSVVPCLVVLLMLTLLVTPVFAAPTSPTTAIGYVEITNVRETSFTISWITDVPSTGVARCYNTGGTLIQTGNDSSVSSVHYVSMTGFSALTTYRCEVESDGVINNNDGAYYSVTTGGTPAIPPPGSTVYGTVLLSDGVTPANGAIVYLRLIDANGAGSPGNSQWVSSQQVGGFWFIDLSSIRTVDATSSFLFTPGVDLIEYWAQGGLAGTWGLEALIETVIPIPPVLPGPLPNSVLNGVLPPLSVVLSDFSAAPQSDGISINWETVSEVSNQGFNLYRSLEPATPQDLLAFVPSQAPGSAQGFYYEWLDSDVVAGETYYYWLESVDLSGATTLHGPVSATYQGPTAVEMTTFTAGSGSSQASAWWLLVVLLLAGWVAHGLHRRLRQRVMIE